MRFRLRKIHKASGNITLHLNLSPNLNLHWSVAPLLLTLKSDRYEGESDKVMTRAQWWAIGAIVLGIAIVAYLVFFCPAECH